MRRLLVLLPIPAAVLACVSLAVVPASGSTTPPKGVTATITLPATAVAGTEVKGRLVLKNAGHTTVDLNDGCTPKWEVVLGKGASAPPVAFSLECGVEPFPVKPGTTKLPFTISTRSSGCSPRPEQVTATFPQCGADGKPPPLATGRYRAFLVANQPTFPRASPVRLRLVRTSTR